MSINNQKFHRRSVRLPEYDYSKEGAYYITICAQDHKHIFGEIANSKILLNEFGHIVDDCWQWLFKQYPYTYCDVYTIMPNHMHAIMIIADQPCRGGSRTAPTMKRKPLGRLIGAFKTVSTKQINILRGTPGRVFWQRNFYEHIIRNEKSYNKIKQYIIENPRYWSQDEENPDRKINHKI